MSKTPQRSPRSVSVPRPQVADVRNSSVHRRCLACGFTTSAIRLLAETVDGRQGELAFVRMETESAAYMNRFPIDGRVRGRICRACGRIELFGENVA